MATSPSKLESSDFKQYILEHENHLMELRKTGIELKSTFNSEHDNVNAIIFFIERLHREKHELSVWRQKIKTIEDIGFEEVIKFGDVVNAEFENCLKDVATPLIEMMLSDQLDKVNEDFKLVLEKLKTFRVHRSEENYLCVHEPFEAFKFKVTIVSELSKRCSISLSENQSSSIQKIKLRFQHLEKQVDIYTLSHPLTLAYQFQFLLHKGLPNDHGEWMCTTVNFDQQIEQFPKDVRQTLDHKFYELSPGPKGGVDWGKKHRWDNLGILNNALLLTIREIKEKEVSEKVKTEDRDHFYHVLHEVAFGPTHQDPVSWAKREFPYLIDLIPAALNEMQGGKKLKFP